MCVIQYGDYANYPTVSIADGVVPTEGAAQPHPDGQPPAAAAGNVLIADEHKAEATNVPAGNHPEPGRNVFQDKAIKNMKDHVASVAKKDDAEVDVKTAETTRAADPAEHEENKAVMPPPPLPPNELNDVRTEGARQEQRVPPPVRQPPQREREQAEQRKQQPDKVAAAQAAAGFNDVADGANAAAAPKPADPPKGDTPADAAATPEATLNEEERIRNELFPGEGA